MNTVQRTFILLALILPLAIQARERKEKHLLPTREIDRPLSLPQRQTELRTGHMAGVTWDKDLGVIGDVNNGFFSPSGYTLPQHWLEQPNIIIPRYRYGFNDSLQLSTGPLGLPTLHFTFLNNSKIENGIVTINKPSIGVFTGLASIYGNSSISNSFEFLMHAGVEGKFPINDKLWSTGKIKVTGGNATYRELLIDVDLGIQVHDKLALIPGLQYKGKEYLDTEGIIDSPTARLTVDYNIAKHFSMDFFAYVSESYTYSIESSFGTSLNFNW